MAQRIFVGTEDVVALIRHRAVCKAAVLDALGNGGTDLTSQREIFSERLMDSRDVDSVLETLLDEHPERSLPEVHAALTELLAKAGHDVRLLTVDNREEIAGLSGAH